MLEHKTKTRWEGNGDGHVYEHVFTEPQDRTWGPLDCPSFVRICHPENAKSPRAHDAKGKKYGGSL